MNKDFLTITPESGGGVRLMQQFKPLKILAMHELLPSQFRGGGYHQND